MSEFKDGYKISAISKISDLFTGDLLLDIEKNVDWQKKWFHYFFIKRDVFITIDFTSLMSTK